MGNRTSCSARARSKAERSSVVEVLEGKAAAAFSRSAALGADEKPPKASKPKKDGLGIPVCHSCPSSRNQCLHIVGDYHGREREKRFPEGSCGVARLTPVHPYVSCIYPSAQDSSSGGQGGQRCCGNH